MYIRTVFTFHIRFCFANKELFIVFFVVLCDKQYSKGNVIFNAIFFTLKHPC